MLPHGTYDCLPQSGNPNFITYQNIIDMIAKNIASGIGVIVYINM